MVKLILILLASLYLFTGISIEKHGNETTITIGNMKYRYYEELM